MLGDFAVKNAKLYLTKIQIQAKTKCGIWQTIAMILLCAIEFLDPNFNQAVIDKILNFQEIPPNFMFLQKSYFLKYN